MRKSLGNFGKLIDEINNYGWANKYLQYLELRKKGLRKQALIKLKEFYSDFDNQSKSQRRGFIDIVNRLAFFTMDYNLYLPINLLNELFKVEVQDWLIDEPKNPLPYLWSHDFELMKQAVQLDSNDQIVLELLGKTIISKVSINQHEIDSGFAYQGDPVKDIELLNYFEQFSQNITDREKKLEYEKIISELRSCALQHIR